MAIQKLEDATVRVLGATQTLTDTASLVKELIDNALDAHATSVKIEISADTLDHVQVRDNGHGIASEDRPMVARPNCTSKITTDDDIKTLRGSSLGFRGQALASAAEVSGALTVTTRVEGEEMAAVLKIDRKGEVVGQSGVGLPVGTTIRIKDFMTSNPVRKQVLVKAADKTLKKIKDLLRSYAFARPKTRLELKVTKAKSDKYNFVYSPKAGGDVQDAALKLVGSACTSQCEWSFVETDGLALSAFLPRVDADVAKVSGVGVFFSVDARPVAPKRGTLKKIITLVRDSLRNANPAFKNAQEVFVYLDIACQDAAYDPNVEPAKDDVLFEDPDAVMAAMEKLLAQTYPAQAADQTRESSPVSLAQVESEQLSRGVVDNFPSIPRLDLFANPPNSPPTSSLPHDEPIAGHPLQAADSTVVQGYRTTAEETQLELEDLRNAQRDVHTSNPWVFAKLNAPIRRTGRDEDVPFGDAFMTPQQQQRNSGPGPENASLLTPRQSSPEHRRRDESDSDMGSPRALPHAPIFAPFPDVNLSRGPLQGQQNVPRLLQHDTLLDKDERPQALHLQSSPTTHAFPPRGTNRRAPQSTPSSRDNVNKPFRPPRSSQPSEEEDGPPVWYGRQGLQGQKPRKYKTNSRPQRNDGLVFQGEAQDAFAPSRMLSPPKHNRDIRDFVGRIDLTEADSMADVPTRRSERGQAAIEFDDYEDSPRPRKRRGSNISASGVFAGPGLLAPDVEDPDFATMNGVSSKRHKIQDDEERILRPLDANAILMSHATRASKETITEADQAPQAPPDDAQQHRKKSGRRRSSRLPLERIPNNQRVHDLQFRLSYSMDVLRRALCASGLRYDDDAVPDAHDGLITPIEHFEVLSMAKILGEALQRLHPDGELVQELGTVLEAALTQHQQEAMTPTQTTASELGSLTQGSLLEEGIGSDATVV